MKVSDPLINHNYDRLDPLQFGTKEECFKKAISYVSEFKNGIDDLTHRYYAPNGLTGSKYRQGVVFVEWSYKLPESLYFSDYSGQVTKFTNPSVFLEEDQRVGPSSNYIFH